MPASFAPLASRRLAAAAARRRCYCSPPPLPPRSAAAAARRPKTTRTTICAAAAAGGNPGFNASAPVTDDAVPDAHKGLHASLYGEGDAEDAHGGSAAKSGSGIGGDDGPYRARPVRRQRFFFSLSFVPTMSLSLSRLSRLSRLTFQPHASTKNLNCFRRRTTGARLSPSTPGSRSAKGTTTTARRRRPRPRLRLRSRESTPSSTPPPSFSTSATRETPCAPCAPRGRPWERAGPARSGRGCLLRAEGKWSAAPSWRRSRRRGSRRRPPRRLLTLPRLPETRAPRRPCGQGEAAGSRPHPPHLPPPPSRRSLLLLVLPTKAASSSRPRPPRAG